MCKTVLVYYIICSHCLELIHHLHVLVVSENRNRYLPLITPQERPDHSPFASIGSLQLHLVSGLPTLDLPVRGRHSRTFAHCHFKLHIFTVMQGTLVIWNFSIQPFSAATFPCFNFIASNHVRVSSRHYY